MKLNQNNWQKIKLGKICKIVSGTTPNTNESLFWNGTLPWITPAEIHETSHIICETERFITEKAVEKNALKLLPKGTVLLTSRAPIGKVGIAGIEMYCNQGFKNLICSDEIYNEYLYFFLKFKSKYLDYLGRGATFKEISKSIVENVLILLPPLSEQCRIVAVLETWDKAISLTKRLIDQKEIQKKHLMRQLLTGKTRLKGFSGKWEKHILSDFTCRITRRNTENNKNIVTISAKFGFIPQTNFFTKNVASSSVENYFLIYKNEFCYNKSYSLGYPSGTIKRLKDFEKSVVTPLYICFAIKDNKHLDYDFFEQYCETGLFNRYLDKIANEGGRAHGLLNVSVNDFFKLPLNVPSIKEQQAISEILSAADRDISLLKEKLAKLQQQKKGLMQILLTGKVRLTI